MTPTYPMIPRRLDERDLRVIQRGLAVEWVAWQMMVEWARADEQRRLDAIRNPDA